MWDPPTWTHRERVRGGIATANERIRVLIADGVDPNGERTLLQELRDAGSFLPQNKIEVARMTAWEPWTGVNESDWLSLRERWGKHENDDDM